MPVTTLSADFDWEFVASCSLLIFLSPTQQHTHTNVRQQQLYSNQSEEYLQPRHTLTVTLHL